MIKKMNGASTLSCYVRWTKMFQRLLRGHVVQTTEDGKEFNITSEVTFPGNYVHKTNSFTNRLKNKLPYKKWKHTRMNPFSDNATVSLPRPTRKFESYMDLRSQSTVANWRALLLGPKKINNDYIKYDHYTTSTTTRYNYNPNVLFVGTIRTISFTYSYTLINMLHGKCNHFPRNQTVQQTSQGSLI